MKKALTSLALLLTWAWSAHGQGMPPMPGGSGMFGNIMQMSQGMSEALTDEQIERFIDSMKELQQYHGRDTQVRDIDGNGKEHTILTRHGFSSTQQWKSTAMRISKAYAGLTSGKSDKAKSKQEQQRQEIMNSNIPPQQKQMMLGMLGNAGGMVSSEEDMAAVKPYTAELKPLFEKPEANRVASAGNNSNSATTKKQYTQRDDAARALIRANSPRLDGCKGCFVKNNTLHCYCDVGDGMDVMTRLNLSTCAGGGMDGNLMSSTGGSDGNQSLYNCSGHLQCGGC